MDDFHYWECKQRNHLTKLKENCSARITTQKIGERHVVISRAKEGHIHAPDSTAVEELTLRNRLKRTAAEDSGLPAKIARNISANFSIDVQHRLSLNAQIRIVKRSRPAVNDVEPDSLKNFEVPEILRTTIKGELFFQGRVESDDNLAFIFASADDITILGLAQYWIADGTFGTVPGLFRQLFTIHASVGPDHISTVPTVYVIMTAKTENLYVAVLEEVSAIAARINVNLSPEVILTDFEKGTDKGY